MLQRRRLLQGTAAVLALPLGRARAQARVTLKFHTFMAPMSQVWLTMHKPWMARVEQASGGRIRFEAYPAMQLGGTPAQLFDQARDGVVDIVWTLPGYTAGRFPRTEVFELPFMMRDAEATSRALWRFHQAHAADEFEGVQVLALHVHGPGALHSTKKAVTSVADLRGMKVRGPSRQATRMLAALGAIPVGMPLPAIPDALGKGSIDACVLPWEVIPSVRVHELVRHHSEVATGGPGLYTANFVLAMNQARYAGLPADLRQVIDAHSGIETSAWLGRTQQDNDRYGRAAAQARGNAVHTFGEAQVRDFIRRSAPVADQWVADMDQRGFQGAALLDSARRLSA